MKKIQNRLFSQFWRKFLLTSSKQLAEVEHVYTNSCIRTKIFQRYFLQYNTVHLLDHVFMIRESSFSSQLAKLQPNM